MKRTLAILLSLLLASPVFAADKFVAKDGSNANPGTIGSPYLTIAYCLGQISQTGGDTCNIRTGTYDEYLYYTNSTAPHGTSFSNAVTLKAYNSEVVRLTATGHEVIIGLDSFPYPNHFAFYWIVQDLILDGAGGYSSLIGGLNMDYVRIQNSELVNAFGNAVSTGGNHNELLDLNVHAIGKPVDTTHCIYITGAFNLMSGGRYHDCTGYGMQVFGGSGLTHDNVIKNVRIYDNYTGHLRPDGHGGGGIVIGSGENNLIYNSLIYNNFGTGVDLDYGCGFDSVGGLGIPCKILNNTIYGNEGGISIGQNNYVYMATAENNIVYLNAYMGSPSTITCNPTYASDCVNLNNLTTNPSFTDPSTFDFTIPAASAAVGYGLNLYSTVALRTDFAGNARANAAFDAGAYTYNASCVPAKLSFTDLPASTAVGASLSPIIVTVQDSGGVTCTNDTSTVTLAGTVGNTWSALASSSSLSKAAVAGIATWTDTSVSPTPGSGSITATDGALTLAISNTISIVPAGVGAARSRIHR